MRLVSSLAIVDREDETEEASEATESAEATETPTASLSDGSYQRQHEDFCATISRRRKRIGTQKATISDGFLCTHFYPLNFSRKEYNKRRLITHFLTKSHTDF